ncbi:hypothetical protein [Umezakia ovalisporum]|uniref:hypothetical protein n=1 Tax=Umezakia ovalisporum TaxID=75695 RepID=UPI002473416D|nr:hypothetical protein [Umezakia ovalisporum]MDH6080408.1 hypothetical protein [Umezakia ovalisporum FSS-44]MDH6094639.1 hypothetical protein [Umezakia ovalisporum CobakiLakeB]
MIVTELPEETQWKLEVIQSLLKPCDRTSYGQKLDAQAIAKELGGVKPDDEWLQAEITRLRGKSIVPLQQVITFHDGLDGKGKARQSC